MSKNYFKGIMRSMREFQRNGTVSDLNNFDESV